MAVSRPLGSHRLKHKDGSYVTVLSRAFLSRDEQGNPVRLVGTHVDITALKQQEEELHLTKFCVDHAPVGILSFTMDGRVISANNHARERLGYSREELCGMPVFELDPVFLPERRDDLMRTLRESGTQTFETVHRNKVGACFPMEITCNRMEYQGNEFIFSFEKEITKRKAMEQALIESEERHRRLVEVSPDAIFIHTEGRLVFMNATAARLLGAERPADLYGRVALDFVHPDCRDMVRQRIENARACRDNPPVEELLVRVDGSTVQVEMVSVHLNYQGADSVLAIARDISEMQDDLLKGQKLESLGVLGGHCPRFQQYPYRHPGQHLPCSQSAGTFQRHRRAT